MKTKYIIIIVLLLSLIIGITLGFFIKSFSNKVLEDYTIQLGIYACHDGCSIATKDSEGFLTNKTWDCWNKCEDYFNEIKCDLEEK